MPRSRSPRRHLTNARAEYSYIICVGTTNRSRQLRQVEETDPNEYDTSKWLSNAYEMKKDYSHALEAKIRQMGHNEATPEEIAAVKAAFDQSGWPGVLRSMVDPKRPTMAVAAAYAQLGDSERAFECLDKAFERHAVMIVDTALANPGLIR